MEIFDAIYGRSEEDSIIAIGSRRPDSDGGESPHFLYALRVKDREEMLPTIFEYLMEQSQYLVPNTLSDGALLGKPDEAFRAGLESRKPEYFAVKNQYVKELCALHVDLDVGRPGGIQAGEALGKVMDRCLNLMLPTPSLAVLSGRGVYLLWLLRDETTIRPPANTPDNCQCWKLIENEICNRLRDLQADPRALRLAQWLKRPGTVDSKTKKEVIYMTFGVGSLRNVPLYRLSELMCFFDLHHTARLIDVAPSRKLIGAAGGGYCQTVKDEQREPIRKVRAGKGGEPWKCRCDEIERLSQHRRGMPEGVRLVTLWHYHQAMEKYLMTVYRDEASRGSRVHQEAVEATLRLNATFRPPLSVQEVLAKVCHRPSGRGKLARNDTVAMDLAVTETEARVLGLSSIAPGRLKAQMEALATKIKAKERQLRERRRDEVDALIVAGLRDRDIITEMERRHPLGDFPVSRAFVSVRRKEAMKRNPPWAFDGLADAPPVTAK